MLNSVFYHSTTRKYVIMFGNMFNDIVVRRFDSTNNELQNIEVPISYGPKMKWLYLLARHPEDQQIAIQIPRLGFEITNWQHDPTRKINPVHKNLNVFASDKDRLYTQYAPIPYKLSFELYSITKNADDAAQITEQIIPFFNEDLTTSMKLIPEIDKNYDIRLSLKGVQQQDTYEDTFQTRRAILWTYSFEMDVWFYGPVRTQGVIKRVQIDLHALSGSGEITNEEIQESGRNARLVVTPGLTANGTPTSNSALTIPYQQISSEDDYGFIEETYDFYDGLKYNPVTGEDTNE